MTQQPAVVPGQAPPPESGEAIEAWERDLLIKVRVLRKAGKRAILFLTDDGAILVFRSEPAGRVMPT